MGTDYSESKFLLGEWLVSPRANRLQKQGRIVTLERKAMDVLVFLAAHAGEVISSDQLLNACWQGQFLGDNPVYKIIAVLRKSLGDDSRKSNYILTVPKRGYQIIETVSIAVENKNNLKGSISRWSQGSPYRGLRIFEPEHHKVFFGRNRAKAEVIRHLRLGLENECGFLLLLGKSGCGKSSLVRAGVVPAVTQAKGFDDLSASGWAVLTPFAENEEVHIEQLFQLLYQQKVIKNTEGLYRSSVKHHGSAAYLKSVLYPDSTNKSGESRPFLVVIDQMEIILGQREKGAGALSHFIECLDVLARSGQVMIIAVLRNDYYPTFVESDTLEALKNDGEQYDLSMPTPAEMIQMIRRPADAAGIEFEHDAQTQEKLCELILADACNNKDVLPLLQYCLEELYQKRDASGKLLLSDYYKIGGLTGALASQAEHVFSKLPLTTQTELPQLLHRLIRFGIEASDPVIRQSMDAGSIWNQACDDLVCAFVDARLFLVELRSDSKYIMIAHDALIRHWPRITGWIGDNHEVLKKRARLAVASNRWVAENRARDFLLGVGKPLNEACSLLHNLKIELSPDEQGLIRASQARVKQIGLVKRLILTVGVMLGGAAGLSAYNANKAFEAAEHSRSQADSLIGYMLGDLHNRLQEVGRLDILDQVGEKVINYVSEVRDETLSLDSQLQYARALKLIGEVRLAQAKNDDALEVFSTADLLVSDMSQSSHEDSVLVLAGELKYWQGYVHFLRGEFEQSNDYWLQYYEKTLELYAVDADNDQWWLELSYALNNLGALASAQGEDESAIARFNESVKWKQKVLSVDSENLTIILELADSYAWLGSAYKALGNLHDSRANYEQELDILKAKLTDNLDNSQWQIRLVYALEKLGILYLDVGNLKGARVMLGEARQTMDVLLNIDPERREWRWDSASLMINEGRLYKESQQLKSAEYLFAQAVTEMKSLIQQDNEVVEWRRIQAVALIRLAAVTRAQDRPHEAESYLNQAITILETLLLEVSEYRYIHTSLAAAYLEVGLIAESKGVLPKQNQHWQKAYTLLSQYIHQQPDARQQLVWAKVLAYMCEWSQASQVSERMYKMGYRTADLLLLRNMVVQKVESNDECEK